MEARKNLWIYLDTHGAGEIERPAIFQLWRNADIEMSKRITDAEARAAELQRSIDGICEFYGALTIVSAVVDMHADRKRIAELTATNATLTKRVAELESERDAARVVISNLIATTDGIIEDVVAKHPIKIYNGDTRNIEAARSFVAVKP